MNTEEGEGHNENRIEVMIESVHSIFCVRKAKNISASDLNYIRLYNIFEEKNLDFVFSRV